MSDFAGVIGDTISDSVPDWSLRPRPARNAPNIVVVVLDDMGWSDLGCFGSEIATPAIDALASDGVRLTNFHVTPLCSPTRASLLTGRNHHAVGMRFLAVSDSGFPNSRGELPRGIDTVPDLLRERGYGTYLAGKWHLTPQNELAPAGPYGNWPLSRGFDRFYGFLGGASDQYVPELYQDNSVIVPPGDADYHLSTDLVDRAIGYIDDHTAYRDADPFYVQLAFGATHAPIQVPDDWSTRYAGRYDDGWDVLREERLERQKTLGVVPPETVLAERDDAVPLWGALTEDERRRAARAQEAYAGFLSHTDAEIARLVDHLDRAGLRENTMIVVMADNGAAGDGGRLGTMNVISSYNGLNLGAREEEEGLARFGDRDHPGHYAAGWAMAGNTPFRLYKQYVDLGGVRSPLIVRWPEGVVGAGGTRDQFAHVTDLAALILDCGIDPSEPSRDEVLGSIDGVSILPVLRDRDRPATRTTQAFEMLGHRAIRHEGWRAVTRHTPGVSYDDDVWRLYDSTTDFSEAHDLAAANPDVLRSLVQLWWDEARRTQLLPLDDRSLKDLLGNPAFRARPRTLLLRPGVSRLGFTTRLTGSDRGLRVRARLDGFGPGDAGVLLASGTSYGGYVLYIQHGTLHFEHHLLGARTVCSSPEAISSGAASVGFRLTPSAGRSAEIALEIDDVAVARTVLPVTSGQLAFYGLDVGYDPASPVSEAYDGPFAFPREVLRDVALEFAAEPGALHTTHLEADQ